MPRCCRRVRETVSRVTGRDERTGKKKNNNNKKREDDYLTFRARLGGPGA